MAGPSGDSHVQLVRFRRCNRALSTRNRPRTGIATNRSSDIPEPPSGEISSDLSIQSIITPGVLGRVFSPVAQAPLALIGKFGRQVRANGSSSFSGQNHLMLGERSDGPHPLGLREPLYHAPSAHLSPISAEIPNPIEKNGACLRRVRSGFRLLLIFGSANYKVSPRGAESPVHSRNSAYSLECLAFSVSVGMRQTDSRRA